MALTYRSQTRHEEILNAGTHGIGLVFAVAVAPFLIIKAGNTNYPLIVWGVSVFIFGMIAVYFSSVIYHLAIDPVLKRKANIVDHISIFFLIGGTYTPIILFYLREPLTMIFFTIQWSIIIIAFVLQVVYTCKYHNLLLALY